jgi:hypothetical protein
MRYIIIECDNMGIPVCLSMNEDGTVAIYCSPEDVYDQCECMQDSIVIDIDNNKIVDHVELFKQVTELSTINRL